MILTQEGVNTNIGNLLILEKEEHLAPKALVTPTGETYAMLAPAITKNNFILVDHEGQTRRMDVGDSGPQSQGLIPWQLVHHFHARILPELGALTTDSV